MGMKCTRAELLARSQPKENEMTTLEHLRAALQHLLDIDQETLSVSLVANGSSYDTQDECYNQARIWLERAINCDGSECDA
jgi:hypothetical protein